MLDAVRERVQPEPIGQPMRKIIGLQLQTQPRRNKVKIERGVAQLSDSFAKLLQRASTQAERNRHLFAFTEIKLLERRLRRVLRVGRAVVADDAAQVTAQRSKRNVIANVQRCQLLRQIL